MAKENAKKSSEFSETELNNQKMRESTLHFDQVFNSNHTLTLDDLEDIATNKNMPQVSWEEAAHDRQPILDLLERAGLRVDVHVLQRLPTWSQVTELYGDEPVILGTETCQPFRDRVPPNKRFVGVAGQMNTGTNALSKYLANNIQIKPNRISRGVLWTVPWYKHAWAALKYRYKYRVPEDHDKVLAAVMVRDPFFWMQSMCQSPYTLEWNRTKSHCPNLIETTSAENNTTNVPIRIQWSNKFVRKWDSLLHVWNSWNKEYIVSDMPHLILRFEDLLFHTQKVVDVIRDCVGATWRQDEFQFQTAPAKTHPYFAKFKAPSSLVSALIKYGQDNNNQRRTGSMTEDDLKFARDHIDPELLQLLHYQSI